MISVWIRNSSSLFHQYVNPSLSSRTTPPSPGLIPLRPVRIIPTPDLRNNQAVCSLEEFDLLHNVTAELDRIILQNKKDSLENQEFSDILDDYFGNSSPLTLEFCSNMISDSRRARGLQSSVKSALDSFQEQNFDVSDKDHKIKKFSRHFLENVQMAAHPFPLDHFLDLNSVYSKQIAMMARLEAKRMKLERTLDRLIAWRKVSIRIFISIFALVLIGSVASVYVKASAGLIALIAMVIIPLGWTGRWLNSTWKKFVWNFREQSEIISVMQVASDIVFHELGGTAMLVERFEIETEDLLACTNLTTWQDEAGLVAAVEEIKKKVDDIVKTVNDLSVQANKCIQETKMAKVLILHRIDMIHPAGGGSNHDISMFP